MSDDKESNNVDKTPWQTIFAYFATIRQDTTPVTNVTGKTITQIKEENMDPATVIALISAILPLIQECRKRDTPPTDEELLSSARGAQGVFAIRRGLRAQGFRGRRFRQANREAVSELKSMSDQELMENVIRAPEMEEDEDGNDGIDYDLFA